MEMEDEPGDLGLLGQPALVSPLAPLHPGTKMPPNLLVATAIIPVLIIYGKAIPELRW
jgi:hypothetical protein